MTDRFSGVRACVDSGQRRIAYAWGDGVRIIGCGLWRDDLSRPHPVPHIDATHVIQEVPVVYPKRGRGNRVNPNDLVGIAAKSGWFCGAWAPMAVYVPISPRKWKGTVNGDAFLKVITSRMSPDERDLLEGTAPPSLLHNVIDACGMVLWSQGRL